ncbi:MAG TPA: TonB family protein, partial [Gemmatimonadaceae bacterium]
PTGTFLQAFEAAGPLREWADAAAALRAPQLLAASNGGADQVTYASTRLTSTFDRTEYRLIRVEGDSAPSYLLTATNGAWSSALPVSPAQAAALFTALRGESGSGAVPYEFPHMGQTPATSTPDVQGAWLDVQVDRLASPGSRAPRAVFPDAWRGTGATGTVRLTFIIDETGVVRPSSVRLIGKAEPAFAAAARQALLAARYSPAMLGGRPVPQRAMQNFDFRQP